MNRLTYAAMMVGGLVALSGCANTQTTCPLNNKEGYCASVQDVNAAARAHAGDSENVMGNGAYKRYVEKHRAQNGGQAPSRALRLGAQNTGPNSRNGEPGSPLNINGVRDPGPGAGLSGPIYTPAQPRRLWVAPWSDAEGVVHSGEYLYFLSPGHWRYGPLHAPGSASGVMGPVSPSDLGFDPSKVLTKNDGGDRSQDPNDPADIQQPSSDFTPPDQAFTAGQQ